MGKKFFMKVLLVALFIAMPFTSVASTLEVDEGLLFDGEIYCDLDGLYYMPTAYPLNVYGLLDVSYGGVILGTLSLNAQKISIHEDWDGKTYFGHWVFEPDYEPGYEWGVLSSLVGCDSGVVLSFILDGFPEVLGLGGDQMLVSGSMEGNTFSGAMVPIPGALLLFGSGLLGLICIRRK